MLETLREALAWVAAHPHWAVAFVFLCCVGESILVLGVLIPTTLVLLTAGALVGLASLGFWVVVVAAVAGAIAGDSINFWVGRYWGSRALESHYAQRYQDAIARSRSLFQRHGYKALVLARFIGLVRPFVAAIAGAYKMPAWRFLLVEFIASLIWAAPLIMLGVVFGASLDLAAEVAARLAVLFVVLFVVMTLLTWLVYGAVGGLQRRAGGWVAALLDWSHRHRRVGRLGEWLADPAQPETPALALLALVLFALGWLWIWLWWGATGPTPQAWDTLAWQAVQDLRTPFTTVLALGLSQLADWQVYGPVAIVVLVTLLLLGHRHAAAHWVAAVAFGTALSLALYWLLKVPDPVNYYRGVEAVRFGGRDLVLATVIYGFVPVLLSTNRPRLVRTLYYAVAVVLIVLMLAADIYRGAVWLSTGVFSVVFGAVWVGLLGVGYRQHGAAGIPAREVLPLALGVLVAAAALQGSAEMRSELQPRPEPRTMSSSTWWREGYAALPAYRVDTSGRNKQPLTVQWRGELPAIDQALRDAGWEAPRPVTWDNALRWLAVHEPIAELPVLPQVHGGVHQALVLRRSLTADEQWVIRLWPSGAIAGRAPVWIGTLTRQTSRGALRLVRFPLTEGEYDTPLAALEGALPGFEARRVQHPGHEPDDTAWDGSLWLLRPQ